MTYKEFEVLKIGDICKFQRGTDKDKLVEVAFIEKEAVLVRALNGQRLDSYNVYNKLRLTSYRELTFIK